MDVNNLTSYSSTTDLSLEVVLERLRQRSEVDAVLLVGSTGQPSFTADSDYDLLIVINDNPDSIFKAVTTIAGRLAELYFITELEIDAIIEQDKPIPANTSHATVIAWLSEGKIVLDHSKKLTQLRDIGLQSMPTAVSDQDIYSTWYTLNYNYKQNLRYAKSLDELRLQVLSFRLLYSIYDCLTGYFVLRRIGWKGEKKAIVHLENNDTAFLHLFRRCIAETDLQKRFAFYEDLVHQAIPAEMGIWADNFTAVKLKTDFTDSAVEDALSFWNSLIDG